MARSAARIASLAALLGVSALAPFVACNVYSDELLAPDPDASSSSGGLGGGRGIG